MRHARARIDLSDGSLQNWCFQLALLTVIASRVAGFVRK